MTLQPFRAPDLQPQMARDFISSWFDGVEGHPTVVAIRDVEQKSDDFGTLSQTLSSREDAMESLGDMESLSSIVYGDVDRFNVYINVGTRSSEITDPRSRGGVDTIAWIPGVWVDLDCKTGRFETEEEIFEYVRSLELRPTIGVSTGSGGVHCYWKFDKPVDATTGAWLARAWWSMLSERAHPRSIDKLIDATRIMKLPGTIRWPKALDPKPAALVSLLYADGPRYSVEQIKTIAEPYRQAHEDRMKETRRLIKQRQIDAGRVLSSAKLGRWSEMYTLATIEEDFAQEVSWRQVLEPHGWTWMRKDHDDREWWARPGGDGGKSATTDWPESPDVMSLLSDSEETGLSDLKEAGVALTKYRVWLRLSWADDEPGFVRSWIESHGLENH